MGRIRQQGFRWRCTAGIQVLRRVDQRERQFRRQLANDGADQQFDLDVVRDVYCEDVAVVGRVAGHGGGQVGGVLGVGVLECDPILGSPLCGTQRVSSAERRSWNYRALPFTVDQRYDVLELAVGEHADVHVLHYKHLRQNVSRIRNAEIAQLNVQKGVNRYNSVEVLGKGLFWTGHQR